MHYLVTGGAGFIGAHLCRALLAAGHRVRVLDDLSTGRKDRLDPGVALNAADICDSAALAEALSGVDGCFHLAAIASVTRCEREWARAHAVNLTASIQLFRLCAAAAVPVVYASSAAVYGECRPPHRETALPAPISAYGADKLACEFHAQTLHSRSAGLRFFNVYGPGQEPGSPYSGVISRFAEGLLKGETLTLYGDGRQTRDFVYVADVAEACARAMAALMAGQWRNEVANVATGHAVSIAQLAETLAELLGTRPVFCAAPARDGDIRHSQGGTARLRRLTGFHAATTLKTGLSETLAWMRQR